MSAIKTSYSKIPNNSFDTTHPSRAPARLPVDNSQRRREFVTVPATESYEDRIKRQKAGLPTPMVSHWVSWTPREGE